MKLKERKYFTFYQGGENDLEVICFEGLAKMQSVNFLGYHSTDLDNQKSILKVLNLTFNNIEYYCSC